MKEQKITVGTIIKLDFVDRLKLLFGRTLKVTTVCLIPQEQPIDKFNAASKTEIVATSKYFTRQSKPGYGYTPKTEQ